MRNFLERLRPFAPLTLRLVLAAILIYYGGHKVLRGMGDYTKYVTSLRLPRWVAPASAWAELIGGSLLGIGFLARLAAVVCAAAIIAVDINGKLHAGFSALELALLSLGACLSILLSGAGRLSIDNRLFNR